MSLITRNERFVLIFLVCVQKASFAGPSISQFKKQYSDPIKLQLALFQTKLLDNK